MVRIENEDNSFLDKKVSDSQGPGGNIKDLKIIILEGRKYMFRVNDTIRVRWDLFVMVLAAWNCLSIPFSVAFQPEVLLKYE